jgi:hypothetical protein
VGKTEGITCGWVLDSDAKDPDKDDSGVTGLTQPSSMKPSVASSFATHDGKLIDAPKAALYEWYIKEHKTQINVSECYFTWDNHGLPHERKFTSIFVCPLTGEVFPSGKHGPRTWIKERIDPTTTVTIQGTRVFYEEQIDPETGANVVWFCK